MNARRQHSNWHFTQPFEFNCLTFAKIINVSYIVSLWVITDVNFQFTPKEHPRYGEQSLRCNVYYILIFINSNAKFTVICKNGDIEYWYISTHTKEKPANITLGILLFYQKNIPTKLPCWVIRNLLLLM